MLDVDGLSPILKLYFKNFMEVPCISLLKKRKTRGTRKKINSLELIKCINYKISLNYHKKINMFGQNISTINLY